LGLDPFYNYNTSIQITRWAYEQAELTKSYVWAKKSEIRPLTASWKGLWFVINPDIGSEFGGHRRMALA